MEISGNRMIQHENSSNSDSEEFISRSDIKEQDNIKAVTSRSDGQVTNYEFFDHIDSFYGYQSISPKTTFTAFVLTFRTGQIEINSKGIQSCLTLYCIGELGEKLKFNLIFNPYFYVLVTPGKHREVINYLSKRFEGQFVTLDIVIKEDLDLPNHLCQSKQVALKMSFTTVQMMDSIRFEIQNIIKNNNKSEFDKLIKNFAPRDSNNYFDNHESILSYQQHIIDIREYDVPYDTRFCINNNLNASKWFCFKYINEEEYQIIIRPDLVEWPKMNIFTYDIECTKLPLKFPDKTIDQIMMISLMINDDGYLINNREIISENIDDFGFSPRSDMKSEFKVLNCPNEKELLIKFFQYIRDSKPEVFATYNGDFFDWSFVESRASVYGINMKSEIGFFEKSSGEFTCHCALHLDCLYWVKRDSYLPFGSHGLKAVAKAKLAYHPIEVDPEEMVDMALKNPVMLSQYSVSDSVATYFLFLKYVKPFIFSLSTILPMLPDQVLRKGTGICCENLLMVEAFKANVIFPNKTKEINDKYTDDGHLLISETYIGGHVEAIECGVFRSDFLYDFRLDSIYLTQLRCEVEKIFENTLINELSIQIDDIEGFEDKITEVKDQISTLIEQPKFRDNPSIVHLDVGAMYPNIMLTNRLQPTAIVDESICSKCEFNRPSSNCKRHMDWKWRGEIYPMTKAEISSVKKQINTEQFKESHTGKLKPYNSLRAEDKNQILKKRLKDYSKNVYKKIHSFPEELRNSTVCQRENSFYIDTVRLFRDRRYQYKKLLKEQNKLLIECKTKNPLKIDEIKHHESLVVIYDSLQLAHKCILNSFYGYVMRKGSRWHSMETGGIICYTGASIIQKAKSVIESIGRSLELDTDGIWCMIPLSFPNDICFTLKSGKTVSLNFPNSILNHTVATKFSNDQYQTLTDRPSRTYKIMTENSIFFEIDGPYLAMILPAAKEEGKTLKKRYAVFNHNKKLQELKGFELKRRGELNLIKYFQENLFHAFLNGNTLSEAYSSAAEQANYWLDILDSKCSSLTDDELFNLISETKNMSRKIEDYGSSKSTAITTARRLSELLGPKMLQDSKITCKYLISKDPPGKPVSQRSIPIEIFRSDEAIKIKLLTKWLGVPLSSNFDVREILDWPYYRERLSNCIKKIITYPAAFQSIPNPVPRVMNDSWVDKMIRNRSKFNAQSCLDRFIINNTQPSIAQNKDNIINFQGNTQNNNQSYSDSLSNAHLKTAQVHETPSKVKKYSILSYSTNIDDLLITNVCEILKIDESKKSGQLIVWLGVGGYITSVVVHSPKIFYIASSKDYKTTFDYLNEIFVQNGIIVLIQEARKAVPMRNETKSILKIVSHQPDQLEHISWFLRNHHFLYPYELSMPLIDRFILYKGNLCTISQKPKKKTLKPEDIVAYTETRSDEFKFESYKYEFVSDIDVSSNKILLHFTLQTLHLSLYFISKNKIDHKNLPSIKSHLSKLNETIHFDSHISKILKNDFEKINWTIDVFEKPQSAYDIIDKKMSENFKENLQNKSKILLYHSNTKRNSMKIFQKIQQYMPLIELDIDEELESDTKTNILNWQIIGLTRSLTKLLKFEESINSQLSKSRFFQIPLGNISHIESPKLLDILVQQQMIHNNCLFDLKNDLNLVENFQDSSLLNNNFIDDFLTKRFKNPGIFREKSCHFSIRFGFLNSVLNFKEIFDAAGYDIYNTYHNNTSNIMNILNEMNPLTSKVFETIHLICKKLYNASLKETHNCFAIKMLNFIEYWLIKVAPFPLRNSFSSVYLLQLNMLVSLIEDQPFCIVLLDSYNLIISYKLHLNDDQETNTIFESFTRNINSKKEFSCIHFCKVSSFDLTLYYDKSNHIFVQNLNSNDYVSPKVEHNFSLANLFGSNKYAKKYFETIIVGYLMSTSSKYLNCQDKGQSDQTTITSHHLINNVTQLKNIAKKLILNDISQCMYDIIENLNNQSVNDHLYPSIQQAIKPIYSSNIAILFATLMCSLFKLDSLVEDESEQLFSGIVNIIKPDFSAFLYEISAIFNFIHLNKLPNITYYCEKCLKYSCSSFNDDFYLDCIDMKFHLHCSHLLCKSITPLFIIQDTLLDFVNQFMKRTIISPIICQTCMDLKYNSFFETTCHKCLQKLENSNHLKFIEQINAIYEFSKFVNIQELLLILNPLF